MQSRSIDRRSALPRPPFNGLTIELLVFELLKMVLAQSCDDGKTQLGIVCSRTRASANSHSGATTPHACALERWESNAVSSSYV